MRERSWRGSLEGAVSGFFFLIVLYLYLPLGYRLSLVNFTYGAGGHEPAVRAMIPQFFLGAVLTAYGTEVLLRGLVLRNLIGRYRWEKAFWIHLLALNVLSAPFLWRQAWRMEGMGFFRYLVMENLLESFWALFFLRTGSLLATGILRGSYNFLRHTVMNDVSGPFETLYFYSAAADDFYWLMIAVTFVAIGVQILINRRWAMREAIQKSKVKSRK